MNMFFGVSKKHAVPVQTGFETFLKSHLVISLRLINVVDVMPSQDRDRT